MPISDEEQQELNDEFEAALDEHMAEWEATLRERFEADEEKQP